MQGSNIVRQYVKGEESYNDFDFFSGGPSVGRRDESEGATKTTEPQLSDKTELAEGLQSGEVKPIPTLQQRRFSVDWDPIQ